MDLKTSVPLEEALNIAGCGPFTYYVIILAGLVDFAAFCGVQAMSVVIPAAGCDLGLTTYQKGVLTSMVYTGMIFSSHMWGFLSDSYGRRTVMMICSSGLAVLTIISSLAPNAIVLMVSSFISGLLLAGIFTPIYVYVGESSPQVARARALLICCALSSISAIYLPGAAWIIIPLEIHLPIFNTGIVFTSWRLYIALLAIPYLLALLCVYILPETPKFLLSQGMHKETLELLRKMYAINHKKERSDFPVRSLCLDISDELPGTSEETTKSLIQFLKKAIRQTKMIFTPPLLKYAAFACLIDIPVVGVFSTVMLWFPEIVNRLVYYSSVQGTSHIQLCDVMNNQAAIDSGSQDPCRIKDAVFIINITNGLIQSVCYYLFSFIVPRFSKKNLVVGISALAAISCSMVIFANEVIFIIIALGLLLVFMLVLFPVYISIIVDLFPTSLRTNATAIIMLCGRISSVLGSQAIGALYTAKCELAYPGLTAILAGMTALFMIMPMTRKV